MDNKKKIEVLKKEIDALRFENKSLNEKIESLEADLYLERNLPKDESIIHKVLDDADNARKKFEAKTRELDLIAQDYKRLTELFEVQKKYYDDEIKFLLKNINNTRRNIKHKNKIK